MKKLLLLTSKLEGAMLPEVKEVLENRDFSVKEVISDKKLLSQTEAETLRRVVNSEVVLLSDMDAGCVTLFKNCSWPTGVVFSVSDKNTESIREAYSRGADMCLPERLDPDLLPWQLEAVFRHYPEKYSLEHVKVGEFDYNPAEGVLAHPDITFKLTPKQRMIFEYLAYRRNKKVLKKDLLLAVYGETSEFAKRSMDVYVSQLRRMLCYDQNIAIRTLYLGTMSLIVRGEAGYEGIATYVK